MLDATTLSRIQFALTIGFHYIFPPLSIGLSLMIVIFEGLYLRTKDNLYLRTTKFMTKLFALSFALGVATGIVQVFAFGNNWGRYSEFVGDVFGSVLAAEGIFAFFLEAGFIGIMLFGWDKVSKRVHYLSSCLVSIGAHFSAVWIVAANSWMQTPAGFKIIGEGTRARAVITSYYDVVFNPSFLDRITHVLIGCWLTGAFFVVSISAYYLLKKRHTAMANMSLKVSLIVGTIMVVLQLISADSSAKGVAKHQPAKLAAMEGVYKTQENTPIYVAGWVDPEKQETRGITIPGGLSFLVNGDFSGKAVKGLDSIPKTDWPYVPAVFQFYHVMIYMWGGMALAVTLGLIYWRKLAETPWLLRYMMLSVYFPFIANQAGWFTAEMGRQPWIVQGIMRTSAGVSRAITPAMVWGSLAMFVVIFAALFALFIFLLDRKIKHGPDESSDADMVYRDPYKGDVR